MIVPRNRLIFWAAALTPFWALAPVGHEAALAAAGLSAALTILALLDAWRAGSRLTGLEIKPPEVVRLTKDRDGRIDIYVENQNPALRRLRLGLALPREIVSPNPDLVIELPPTATSSVAAWPCRASRRGRYFLRRCFLEAASPLGFWAVRRSRPIRTEVRVYPNLLSERQHLAALFLRRGGLGVHAQRQIGKGRDFEKLREYQPSDSYDDIYWKATAKRAFPVTKIFQIERTQEVYVILDASRLSGRGASRVSERRLARRPDGPEAATILERFVTAALIMGLAAEKQGDLFGLLSFSDRVKSFIRAKNGRAHYDACREALYTVQPEAVTPDFNEVFTFVTLRLRRRALLVFLTNMDDPVLAESFVRNINMVSRRHLVLVNMIRPPGARPLFSSPDVKGTDDLYRNLGGHYLWASLRETERVLKQKRVAFYTLENERLCADLVSQYLGVKQRQAL
ncbi:MAG: DUF58 domain-containing protein [Thermodesulfobacteriota bacterium]